MNKFLVTGASGGLGRKVILHLLDAIGPERVIALARNPEKVADLKDRGVEIRQGDYNDYNSLVKAFQGIDKLLFVSSSEIVGRAAQQDKVVQAAKAAGVRHVVYTSFQRKDESPESPIWMVSEAHLATEQALKNSGLSHTILKNGLYADVLPMFLGEQTIQSGVVYQPAQEGKAAFTLRDDLAEATAKILLDPQSEGKTYELASDKSVSYRDIANYLGDITGKPFTYVSPSPEEFEQTLTAAGVPAMYIAMMKGFAVAVQQGEFDLPDPTLGQILGREPISVADYLRDIYGR